MDVLSVLLYLVAAVCFAVAMFRAPARLNLVAAGLLAWVLVLLLGALRVG